MRRGVPMGNIRGKRLSNSDSLENLLRGYSSPVARLSDTRAGGFVFPVVPPEHTSWQNEQRAWREDCVLMDQTHHMVDLYINGPDTYRLLSDTAVNSFANFGPGKAKQYVACNHDGHLIGDGILICLRSNEVVCVGLGPAMNWLQFQAQTGGYDVSVTRDERTRSQPDGHPIRRKCYRYQIQGPKAWGLIEELNGSSVADIKFFHTCEINIAGRKVAALRHGMAGAAGLEIWGPYEDQERIRDAILQAGEQFKLQQVGYRSYAASALESGWVGAVLPAIYSGPKLQQYREWLPAMALEAFLSLGGSFHSPRIEDYYLTPFDVGYDALVAFDHDFIGREALQAMFQRKDKQRRKVTLAWRDEDVAAVFGSMFRAHGPKYKYIDLPVAQYAFAAYDRVVHAGKDVGFSLLTGYTANERTLLSIATLDRDIPIGAEVALVWGERRGTYNNIRVEPHDQIEIRATVSPAPYSKVARETLRG